MNKERQASKPIQQPQQEEQKGPHPSVLLQELHEMVRLQGAQLDALAASGSRYDEAIKLQSAMLDDVISTLSDLNSAVQTLLIASKTKTTRQGDPVEQLEVEEDQEASEDLADEAEESTSEETPDEDGMWDEEEFEPDPAPRPARRAAQPAQQTQTQSYEGPRPLPLPYSQASQLRQLPDRRGGRV
jgi:hypothetical protein